MSEPLDRGAREHYDDALYYDHTYRTRTEDVAFYRELVRAHGEPVLEIGGGSGRVSIPLAHDGARVTVLDASAPMLARAKERVKELPRDVRSRLVFRRADMRRFKLDATFPLVIAPFNVVQHLYEPDDFRACFACVRAHLKPDGLFVFDARVPQLRELIRDPHHVYRSRPFVHPALGVRVAYEEQFAYDPIKQVQTVTMRFRPEAPPNAQPVEVQLTHRQIFPNEMRALLALGGLRLAGRRGDFSGRPLGPDDDQQIVFARPA